MKFKNVYCAWTITLFVLGLNILMLNAPVYANETKRLALVIGNNAYQQVDPLKNAVNDAKLMAASLRRAGFQVTEVKDVNRDAMWKSIDAFKKRINKGDDVVFYFAGHGVQIESNQVLLPIDISANNDAQVQRDGIPLVDVQDAVDKAKFALLIIDACRNNPFPKTGTRSIAGGARGLVPPEPSTGQVIVMSAGRNQLALDSVPGGSLNNGLFTSVFAKVIQIPGIEIREAMEQVKNKVDDQAKAAGHEQRPGIVSDMRGNFYFTKPKAVDQANVVTPADPETKTWEAAESANSAEAYQLYLRTYPTGRYAAAATIKLAALKPVIAPVARPPVPDKPTPSVVKNGEESTWSTAQRRNTEDGYRQYLEEYPNGRYVNNASKNLAAKGGYVISTKNGVPGYYRYVLKTDLVIWAPQLWKDSFSGNGQAMGITSELEREFAVVGIELTPRNTADENVMKAFMESFRAQKQMKLVNLQFIASPRHSNINGIRVTLLPFTATRVKNSADVSGVLTIFKPSTGKFVIVLTSYDANIKDKYQPIIDSITGSVAYQFNVPGNS